MRSLTRITFLAFAALLTMAGCGIRDPLVGAGPIELSSVAQKAFGDYKARAYPRHFAVSADGNAFYYSYCPVGRCLRASKIYVVKQCEAYSDGVPCKIYGSSGNIVWFDES